MIINYVSFDYSITSPSMCVSDGVNFDVYSFSSVKKYTGEYNKDKFRFFVDLYPEWKSPQDRYHRLGLHFLEILRKYEISDFIYWGIEDYAFAAKGKVFHIAENTQCLKGLVYDYYDTEFLMISPNSIKKVFSGKGNSNKERMAEAFKEQYGFSVGDVLDCKFDKHPADMVDSIAVNICLQKLANKEITKKDLFKAK